MKTFYDIQQYLKRYGTFIYLGNRLDDLELMKMELQELFNSHIIDTKDYQLALLVIHQEIQIEKQKLKMKE